MRQNIVNNLNRLFAGGIDTVKVTYHTSNSYDVIKFEMLGHEIIEENDMITVYDNKDSQSIPKSVNIEPLMVREVTYEDGKTDGMGIYRKSVVIDMMDGSRIEMETVGIG